MAKFKQKYWFGIIFGVFFAVLDIVLFRGTRYFVPGLVLAVTIGWAQFWTDFFLENARRKEYESRFLELVRNLVGAVKSGMPVSKAIVHIANTSDYGALTPHVKKLANKVEWSISVKKALSDFSLATGNDVIKRAVSTVIEAEQAGGNIEDVLESITVSLLEIKKIKESRRASIHGQIIQSYIIFFVFLAVMVVIQSLLIPYLGRMQSGSVLLGEGVSETTTMNIKTSVKIQFSSVSDFVLSATDWFKSIYGIFLMLALIQGFFAGIVIGKLSEGDLVSGVRHSLILMTVAILVITITQT
ncbi:type II secretion system F family protein [Candidatus Woesearchaeota archaeon]|nr:type II secretion system F family protein [Candidatus Woesearchaeota archaeon]